MKHMKFLSFFLGVTFSIVACSSNNEIIPVPDVDPDGDDSLYPIFQRAIKWRTQPQGLLIADTLYAEATQKKDKKAQCLALTIPVSFYLSTNNYEKLEQAATRAKEEARKNNYLQYYYSACTNEINCLLNNGHSLRALQKAEEMKIQAFKDQHEYGIFSCIFTLGNIYYMRQNREVATEYYKNALLLFM